MVPILPDHSWCIRKQIQLDSNEDRERRFKKLKEVSFQSDN